MKLQSPIRHFFSHVPKTNTKIIASGLFPHFIFSFISECQTWCKNRSEDNNPQTQKLSKPCCIKIKKCNNI